MTDKQSQDAASDRAQRARLEERVERLTRRTSELRRDLILRGEEAVRRDLLVLEEERRQLKEDLDAYASSLSREELGFREGLARYLDDAHRLIALLATMSVGALAFSISFVTAFSEAITFRSWLRDAWISLTVCIVCCAVERFGSLMSAGWLAAGVTSRGRGWTNIAGAALVIAFVAFIFGVVQLLVFGVGNLYER
jgi:hypothetical protein